MATKTYILRIYPSRFGFLVEPYKFVIGFDYNKVYNKVDDAILDFKLHGWNLVKVENQFYSFQKDF